MTKPQEKEISKSSGKRKSANVDNPTEVSGKKKKGEASSPQSSFQETRKRQTNSRESTSLQPPEIAETQTRSALPTSSSNVDAASSLKKGVPSNHGNSSPKIQFPLVLPVTTKKSEKALYEESLKRRKKHEEYLHNLEVKKAAICLEIEKESVLINTYQNKLRTLEVQRNLFALLSKTFTNKQIPDVVHVIACLERNTPEVVKDRAEYLNKVVMCAFKNVFNEVLGEQNESI